MYTKEMIENLIKKQKNELRRTIFFIEKNDGKIRDGLFVSLKGKYLTIKNNKLQKIKIHIEDIKIISLVVLK